MPVFKAFFAIAKKRRNAALIYLGVYAVITLLLSALSQDSINENFKASQRSIAITDEDNTDASRALCDYLASIHQVTTPEPGEDTALLDAIYYRTLNYAMVIPEGFEDRVLAGETKDLVSSLTIPGSSSSQYVDNQITQYVQALQLYLAGGDTIAEAIDHTDHTISDLPKVSVTSFQMSDADTNSMVFYFFQYLPVFCIYFIQYLHLLRHFHIACPEYFYYSTYCFIQFHHSQIGDEPFHSMCFTKSRLAITLLHSFL